MDKISIVVPCFNEECVLPIFYETVERCCSEIPACEFEYIFIDDGSKDGTLSLFRKMAEDDKRVHYISFSRNFGKESAIYAGLRNATGDYIVIMDADMQDPPELIKEMYQEIRTGEFDCIASRRVTRKGEPPIRSSFAHLFYKIINRMSQVTIVDGARDYRMMTRQMLDAVLSMPEYNRFSKGIFSWVGFQTKWLEYENVERAAGETKWSFFKLLKYSMEGVIGYSTAPLAFASIVGIIIFLLSIVLIIIIIVKTLIWGDPVPGWPTLACIILFVGGIQLFGIGISSQYVAKTYLEVKRRPIYISRETDHSYHEKKNSEP